MKGSDKKNMKLILFMCLGGISGLVSNAYLYYWKQNHPDKNTWFWVLEMLRNMAICAIIYAAISYY